MTPDLSYFDLLIVSGLVVVSVALSLAQRLGLAQDIVISCIRAFVQLTAVGIVLAVLFRNVEFYWVALAVLVMILAAVQAGRGRLESNLPGLTRDIAFSIAIVSVVTLVFVVGLVIRPGLWYDPQIIVPLAGMIVGNTMTATTLAANHYLAELRLQQQDVEALLALGATSDQAAENVSRESVRSALIPTIAGMMVVGIALLPGTMTGQILAGQDPTQAVRYQLVVQYMMLFAAVATSLVIVRLIQRRYFTRDHQLRLEVLRPAESGDNSRGYTHRVYESFRSITRGNR
jgi:putative ABC transport system permease protein